MKRSFDHGGHFPSPAPQDSLQKGQIGIVQFEIHEGIAGLSLDIVRLLPDVFRRRLGIPLQGRMGFRRKRRQGDVDHALALVVAGDAADVADHLHDTVDILIGFGRQSQHEIQLDQMPAVFENQMYGIVQFLIGDIFADKGAKPFGAGLGGECQPGFARRLQSIGQLLGKRPGTHRRHRQRHVFGLQFAVQLKRQRDDIGIVAR